MEIFTNEWYQLSKQDKKKYLHAITSYDSLYVLIFDHDSDTISKFSKLIEDLGMFPLVHANVASALDVINTFGSKLVFIISGIPLQNVMGKEFRKKVLEFTNDMPFINLYTSDFEKDISKLTSSVPNEEEDFFSENLEPTAFISRKSPHNAWFDFLKSEITNRLSMINSEVKNRNNFIEIALKLIKQSEEIVLSLEEASDVKTLLDSLYGQVHTLKGGSSFLQPRTLEKFLHKFEDYLNLFRNNNFEINSNIISQMLAILDKTASLANAFVTDSHQLYSEEEFDSFYKIPELDNLQLQSKNGSNNDFHLGQNQNEATLGEHDAHLHKSSDSSKSVQHGVNAHAVGNNHAGGGGAGNDSAMKDKYLKVPISLLDNLMQISGEQTVIRNIINKLNKTLRNKYEKDEEYKEMYGLLEELHKLNTQIQGQILELRKVPAKEILSPLNRVVRDAAKQLGKSIQLKTLGNEIRIDTSLSEILSQTLIHLVRNSIDHGIEQPQERQEMGKARAGLLTIEVSLNKDYVYANVTDDGKGLQTDLIKARIIKNGLLTVDAVAQLSDEDIWSYIFAPGFSTAEKVTDISGRGIGMSAVKESVENIGGEIIIQSQKGLGSNFTLALPSPKSVFITRCLFVKIEAINYGIMIDNIQRILHLDENQENCRLSEFGGSIVLTFNNLTIPVVSMNQVLDHSITTLEELSKYKTVVIMRTQKNAIVGLFVDSVYEFEDTVVKAFTDYFKEISKYVDTMDIFYGTTYLGDGTVGLILNVDGLMNSRQSKTSDSMKTQQMKSIQNKVDSQVAIQKTSNY